MLKRIDYQDTLIQSMKSGINLFVGAGFSLYAKDSLGRPLPTGGQLLQELHNTIGKGQNDLARYCSVMERKNRSELYEYLTNRFQVKSFDDCYLEKKVSNYIALLKEFTPQTLMTWFLR